MELRHLRYFVAVSEERSFLKAAARLHISQPPLSTQIKDLERQLGVTLLHRSSKGIALTEPGKVFYTQALAVLAAAEHARMAAQRAARGDEGRLSIGFISIVDYSFLPAALRVFRTRYPGVDVGLHELTTDAQLRELGADKLDVGLALAPVVHDDLAYHEICAEPLVIAMASDHRLLPPPDQAIAMRGLADESFVMVPRAAAPGYFDAFAGYCRRHGFSPRIEQQARQMQTVVSLVANNFGIALVPQSLRNLQRTGVAYRRLEGGGPAVNIGLVHRKTADNPAISRFLAVVQETVAAQGDACPSGLGH